VNLNVSDKVKKMYNAHTDYIGNIDKYDITVSAYRNNMTGNYMITTKIMPICSLNFMYAKNIVVGYLFNIYLYFILDGLKNYFLKESSRLILATTKASENLFDFKFTENDFIIFGTESSGAPDYVHNSADFRVKIFMKGAFRSINIATSTGIFLAKARNDIG